ncbi:hypothetical protein [uncultured Bacteroides sp.]|uniref:hypothetical protein n=1 Tax=uncultured Bacteroides sp. TaxID=162156 RepID=UPI0025F32F67|nr:hypothetical protein [uncultured Bacteroides sp.]
MASAAVNNYISKRYERWFDYSLYHCGLAGIPDEAYDVLNEVLCSLLQKNDRLLDKLFETKKNGYTELDFFVLRMIKLNASSPTSQYRSRYKPLPADENVDYTQLDVEDVLDEAEDKNNAVLERLHQVRTVFESLDLGELAARVFEFRFFQDENFSDWEGPETLKQLYEVYNGVQELIRKKIAGESIF